jgi:hypothetical protein
VIGIDTEDDLDPFAGDEGDRGQIVVAAPNAVSTQNLLRNACDPAICLLFDRRMHPSQEAIAATHRPQQSTRLTDPGERCYARR